MQKNRKKPRAGLAIPIPVIVIGALLPLAVAFNVLSSRGAARDDTHQHPDPRGGMTHEYVERAVRYAAYPEIAEIYTMAAQIPNVLDGLYCHCDCSQHSDHYSLLDCFRDDHGASCDICLGEAKLAYEMTQQGRSLDEIRAAVDAMYGA